MIKKIIVTGGDGRFAKELKRIKTNYNFIFRKKHELNILSLNSIENNFKKFRPDYICYRSISYLTWCSCNQVYVTLFT